MKPDVFGLDFKFTKINSDGDVIYSRFYGGASHEYCRSIIQTADDGFMLIGSTMSFGAGDIDWWIIKINADGDSIWSRTYGGLWSDKCNSIIEMPDGGFVLAGNYGSDCWAIKINADGDSIWSRTYEIGGHNFCESAILTTDGRIALVGSAYSHNPDNWDAWLLLINENGDSLLSCLYENNGNNDCNSIIEMPDGGFVLAGNTTSFGANNKDFWLIRTGSRGNILWSKTYGTEEYEECRSLIENPDGSYTLAGSKGPTDLYSANMWLVKTGIDQLSTQVMPLIPVGTLLQVFPNPFNSSAIIHYAVPPGFEQVSLLLVDPYGREVNKLFNGPATGDFHITINGQNLPSGFYFLQLQSSSSTTIMQKVTLIK
ncbi:MAG: T9SS type A sorting domain-containing protein [Patescibacteria group bacterium]